jgi:fumarate reductase subunit C
MARRPYVRPIDGWWKRNPFFRRYMAREATAVFVVLYALWLLLGLARLAQGRVPYEAWLDAHRSPWSLLMHAVLLAAFAFHTWSWFRIMPKTLPPIVVGGHRLAGGTITALGLAASITCSLALLLAWTWLAR